MHAGDYHLLGDGCKHTLTGKGWVHKIKNVANHFPKPVAAAVKSDLNDIQHAGARAGAPLRLLSQRKRGHLPTGAS